MANYQALGTGPVSFVDANQNQQEIPLALLSFDANGVNASNWPPYAANKAVVDALLAQIVANGMLLQGNRSLTITPAEAGVHCNRITVTFSNPSTAQGTVSVAVTATQVFTGLTPETLSAALGAPASPPIGLVTLQSQSATEQMPQAFMGEIGPTGVLVVPDIANDTAGAFTLATTDSTYTINVTVAVETSSPSTFTLTLNASKIVNGVTLAALESTTSNPFALLVMFSDATSSDPASIPSRGTVILNPVT